MYYTVAYFTSIYVWAELYARLPRWKVWWPRWCGVCVLSAMRVLARTWQPFPDYLGSEIVGSGREPCLHVPLPCPSMRHECALALGSHSSTATHACLCHEIVRHSWWPQRYPALVMMVGTKKCSIRAASCGESYL